MRLQIIDNLLFVLRFISIILKNEVAIPPKMGYRLMSNFNRSFSVRETLVNDKYTKERKSGYTTNGNCTRWRQKLPKDVNILTDAEMILDNANTIKKYPVKLHLVKFYDEEQNQELAFLTNAFHITSLEVSNIYKYLWKIELFEWQNSTSRLRDSGVPHRMM